VTRLRVKDFDKFQHYKDRSPPWIKLYNSLLDDYEFSCLQDASRWHLVAIWLLASRSDNSLPDDAAWLTRMSGSTTPVNIETLISTGLVERYDPASGLLAERKRDAMPEGEAEREGKKRESQSGGKLFSVAWQEYPKRAGGNSRSAAAKAYGARLKAGAVEEEMVAGVRRYAAFVRATGKEGTEYVKQAATFFGPDEHWKEAWDVPMNGSPNGREARTLAAVDSFLKHGSGNGES
jgi:hypothetical protein